MAGSRFGSELDGLAGGGNALFGDICAACIGGGEVGPVKTGEAKLPRGFGVVAVFVEAGLGLEESALDARGLGFLRRAARLGEEEREQKQGSGVSQPR